MQITKLGTVPDENVWATNVLSKLQKKISAEMRRLSTDIPYIPVNGHYEDEGSKDITWWTNGFWAGMLWQLYHATGDKDYETYARFSEKRLDDAFTNFMGLDHDVGFMWLHTAVADYRLTKHERSLARGLHAANLLNGRYNPIGKFIKAWNPDESGDRNGWVIIDSMMNISLLYWARDVTNDPRYDYIARTHADTVMQNHVRADGSVNHICIFDPKTGELLETRGGQGYGVGSSWSRGQAWAIYGFALSYVHTHDQRYLDTAKRAAHYFLANIERNDYESLVDFRAPKDPIQIDTSAAAIAACGLLEIGKQVPDLERQLYVDSALKILKHLDENNADYNVATDGIITDGSVQYNQSGPKRDRIVYADYFFVEAILRILGKDFLIW